MRGHAKTDVIPEDLRVFDVQRWVQEAIDADDIFIRHIPPEQVRSSEYVTRIIAPARFRAALWASVGQRRGDAHFYGTLRVQGGTAAAVWADS